MGMINKDEALKLASQLDGLNSCEPVIIKACEDMIRRLVEELDKQDKPVAWSCWNEDMVDLPAIILFTEPDKYEWQSIKPLYTTPQTKPLSDEEITYQFQHKCPRFSRLDIFKYAVKWAEERHGIK